VLAPISKSITWTGCLPLVELASTLSIASEDLVNTGGSGSCLETFSDLAVTSTSQELLLDLDLVCPILILDDVRGGLGLSRTFCKISFRKQTKTKAQETKYKQGKNKENTVLAILKESSEYLNN
jgi:hypothetical protein